MTASAPPEGSSAATSSQAATMFELARFIDDLIEHLQRERRSLARGLSTLLPAVAERVGVRGVVLRTFGEELTLRTFAHPDNLTKSDLVRTALDELEAGAAPTLEKRGAGLRVVARKLDVAGEAFGAGAFILEDGATAHLDPALALETVCEELDNFLYAIRAAREKQRVTQALVHALQHRVLSEGLSQAVRILAEHVKFARLLLVLRAEQSEEALAHVAVYEGTTCAVDTMAGHTADVGAAMLHDEARRYLGGDGRGLLLRFGFAAAQEEVLLFGVTETTLIGKIVVASPHGDFDTHDRDLLSAFGDFICQRVVDFNKEYRMLARSFCADDVGRMLRTSDYVERYLKPREREVAMLYVDISGFTRVCEQILVDPGRIGRLIDAWGDEAVRILFQHGGVFDKMVGDCVIGLFGPPFYERSEEERIAAALDAALAIRAMTNALPERDEFAILRQEGLAVSTGVHFAPLFVGLFGPNENFTGFSAGMNNTARLQAQAARNEICVMEETVRRLGATSRFRFGDVRRAKVKNVAEPIEFRPLLSAEQADEGP